MVARQMRFTEQCAHMHMTARRSQGKVGAFTLILSLASKSAYNADSFRAPSQISFFKGEPWVIEMRSSLAASFLSHRGYCAFARLEMLLKRNDGIFRHFVKNDGNVTRIA